MRGLGQILAVVGVLGFLAAMFLMPTTVEADAFRETVDVVNLDLQQRQLLTAAGFGCLFLAGIILTAAGAILEALLGIGPVAARTGEVSLPAAAIAQPVDPDADTMERFGITKEPNGYRSGDFVYGSLSAAIRASQERFGNVG